MAPRRVVCMVAATEHDKLNSRDSKQFLLIDDKRQQLLIVFTSGAVGAKSAIYDCAVSDVAPTRRDG